MFVHVYVLHLKNIYESHVSKNQQQHKLCKTISCMNDVIHVVKFLTLHP